MSSALPYLAGTLLMSTHPRISLDANWQGAILREDVRDAVPDGDAASWLERWPVPQLQTWQPESARSNRVSLERAFYLEPADFCVSYLLVIEAAPMGVTLAVNRQSLGELSGAPPYSFDVTDLVALEDNVLQVVVNAQAEGGFGAVYLEQIPCE